MTTQYKIESTSYDDGEAEYDASDYPHQIIQNAGSDNETIICICPDKDEAEHIAKLLNANPFPQPAGERVV